MSHSQNIAVLIGDMNLLRCFEGSNVNTYILSREPEDVLRYSRYYQLGRLVSDPIGAPQKFIADMVEIGQTFKDRPVLYFCNDAILLEVSRHRDQLEKYYRFLMPPPDMVEDTVDKTRFGVLSEKYDLPTPRTIRSSQVTDPREVLKEIKLPCILKPDSRHHGWDNSPLIKEEGGEPQKVVRADTPDEFLRLFEGVRKFTNNFVIQPYIPGGDNCIYSFHAYFNRNSESLAHFVGRKIRTYPKDSGVSTYLELVSDPEFVKVGLDVLRKLNFVGPVKLDFKKDIRDGKYYLLELNARNTLWNHLGAVCGINIPLVMWADLRGEKCEPQFEYRTGVKWLSLANDYKAFRRSYHRDKDLTWLQWLSSFRGPKVYDLFSWRDPLPAMINMAMNTRYAIGSLIRS